MNEPNYRIISLEEEKQIRAKYIKEALDGRMKDAPPISLGSEFDEKKARSGTVDGQL